MTTVGPITARITIHGRGAGLALGVIAGLFGSRRPERFAKLAMFGRVECCGRVRWFWLGRR